MLPADFRVSAIVSPVVDLTDPAMESEVFLMPSETDFKKSPIDAVGQGLSLKTVKVKVQSLCQAVDNRSQVKLQEGFPETFRLRVDRYPCSALRAA